jgi:transcriptional regulator with XRE-family HTH domain
MSDYQKEIGRMLRAARKLSKTEIEDAATEVQVHPQTIYKYERGDLQAPPIKLFILCLTYALNGAEVDDLQKMITHRHADIRPSMPEDLPIQLKKLRERARLSQRELAKIIGIKRNTEISMQTAISEIERGINIHPQEWEAAQRWIDEQVLKYKNNNEIVLPMSSKPKNAIIETMDMRELFSEFMKFITSVALTERRTK